jgi:hypothetical protein
MYKDVLNVVKNNNDKLRDKKYRMCLHISSVWNDCSCGLDINHISREKSDRLECIFTICQKRKTIRLRIEREKELFRFFGQ